MAAPRACCTTPPVPSNYQAQGTEFTLGNMKVYETKDKTPKAVLICIYDIFGFHPNTLQFADLSACGAFRVTMPDFFRGKPYSLVGFPPKDPTEFKKWVATAGSWDNVVKSDVLAVVEHYKKQGATTFGMFGFCWGGKMSLRASGQLDMIKAVALVHPSIEISDVEPVKTPVLFLPSKDELDMLPMVELVKKQVGADKVDHHRFDDMTHGFAGARGDWNNDLTRKRAEEAISFVHSFMKKYVV